MIDNIGRLNQIFQSFSTHSKGEIFRRTQLFKRLGAQSCYLCEAPCVLQKNVVT